MFHFSTYFDMLEMHIDLSLLSPIFSNYPDGRKTKKQFFFFLLVLRLIALPQFLLHCIIHLRLLGQIASSQKGGGVVCYETGSESRSSMCQARPVVSI